MNKWLLGAAVALAAPTLASAAELNFDGVSAPYFISDAARVTNQYAAQGIVFGGHGAIVNSVGDFGTGFSAPNVLAFASGQQFTGSAYSSQTYDTVRFSAPQSNVTFDVGTGLGSPSLDIQTFDAMGKMLGDQMITLGQAFQMVTLTGGFSSFALNLVGAGNGDAFAIDNLSFTAGPAIPAPEPWTAALFAVGIGGVLGIRRRVR
jgi:hypothetical protein